jgi:beta-1,4-mannosyltransferase
VVSSVLLCRALGKRVIWTVHEVLPHSGERRINSWLTGFFLSRLAERIIVHNRYSAERIRKFFGVSRTIEVVELPDYRIIPIDQKQAKDKLGESRFLYLFFGYFHGYRGANLLIEHFDTKKLQAVLYVQGHFGQPIRKKNIVRIAQNGIIIKAENMSEEMLDLHISAADVIVLPYRVCFTSAAAHRAIQHGKLLVVSKAVARTLDNVNDRIIVFENENDLPAALEKARQMDTASLPPKTSLNFEQSEYRQRLQKFYR